MDESGTRAWQTLNRLLAEALALPEAEREAWLHGLDGEAPEHRATLRALLARGADADDPFMREPVRWGEAEPADEPGDRVGPWQLVRALGAGGMSTVWLAGRADGAFRREVALKLPHASMAGAAGHGLARRMARERDILAALEHPGIARLYDAGVTAEGRPWLAMERIDGVPIDVFAREQQLGVPAILALLLQVADALAHAHARLIVHRDLKPANILVTARGEVRLLDFGIAKLLHDDTADGAPGLTQWLGRALTPDYASPEQVGLRPVTVATDVYSLGIVAYELLTGERPYRVAHASAAALEEAIQRAEVPAASRRVGTSDRALARALRGDIDIVLAKALRKDPAARYPSIESFAADLRRHLDGEPIQAQRPRASVRLARFARRHRMPLAAGAAVLVSLVAGLAAALWQAHEATRLGDLAKARLTRSEAAFEFASRLIGETAQRGESIGFEQLLQRAERIAGLGGDAARLDIDAVEAIAEWFAAYGSYERAEALLTRAIDAWPADADAGRRAELACQRASARANLGRWDEAAADLATAGAGADTVRCTTAQSFIARHRNDAHLALSSALQARRAFEAAGGASVHERALIVATLAFALSMNGRAAEAQSHYRQAAALLQSIGREESAAAVTIRNNWALALSHAGRPREALAQVEQAEAIALRRSPSGRIPGYLSSNRGHALRLLERHDEALSAYDRLVEDARGDPNPGFEVIGQAGRALALHALGRAAEARAAIAGADAVLARHALHPDTSALRTLQLARAQLGTPREADAAHAALQARDAALGLSSGQAALPWIARAAIAIDERRLGDAQAHVEAALTIAAAGRGEFDASVYSAQAWRAMARLHAARGDAESARAAAERATAQWIGAAASAPLTTMHPPAAPPPRSGRS